VSLRNAFAQGAFGMGSFAGSMVTGIISYNIFTFLAIFCVVAVPFCFIFPSPEDFQEEEK
jgi:hypothetical protein